MHIQQYYGYDSDGRWFISSKQAVKYHKGINKIVANFWQPQNLSIIDDEYFIGRNSDRQKIQIKQSLDFLMMLKAKYNFPFQKALQCGCGNGRVTQGVLAKMFKQIDIIDYNKNFIEITKKRFENNPIIHNSFQTSFQDFQFNDKYDMIWGQWTLCYLNDEEVIRFLVRAKLSLNVKGVIVIKENSNQINRGFYYESSSGQIHRSQVFLRYLFQTAGLQIVQQLVQKDETFPGVPLKLFCLSPF